MLLNFAPARLSQRTATRKHSFGACLAHLPLMIHGLQHGLARLMTPSRKSPACIQLHSPKSLPLASSPSLTRRSESFAVQRTTYRLGFVSLRPMSLLPLVHRREHVGVVLAHRMQRTRRTWTCCAICAMSSACVAPANTCTSLSLMQTLFP